MRIERIKLVRFGAFENKEVGDLADGLNVITGPAEAGKSTLLGALRFALFGTEFKGYEVSDNPREMEVRLWWNGKVWTLRRSDKSGRGGFSLQADDGERVPKKDFDEQWLGGLSLSTFRSIYGIDLDDLKWDGPLRDLLLVAEVGGLGTRLRDAIVVTQQAAAELFTPAASVRPLNRTLADWREAHNKVCRFSNRPRELEEKQGELARLEEQARRLRDTIADLTRQQREARALLDAYEQWEKACNLRTQADGLKHVEKFSLAAKDDFERAKNARDTAQSDETTAASKRQQAEDELNRLLVDEQLLAHADEIGRLARAAVRASEKPSEMGEAEQAANNAQEAAQRLAEHGCGHGVNAESLRTLDASATVQSELDAHARQLDGARTERIRAEGAEREAKRSVERAARGVQQAEEQLNNMAPAITVEPLREQRALAEDWLNLKREERLATKHKETAEAHLQDMQSRKAREDDARRKAEEHARQVREQQEQAQAQTAATASGTRKVALIAAGGLLTLLGVILAMLTQTVIGAALLGAGITLAVIGATLAPSQVTIPTISVTLPDIITVTDEDIKAAGQEVSQAKKALEDLQRQVAEKAAAIDLAADATEEDARRLIAKLDRQIEEVQNLALDRHRAESNVEAAKRNLADAQSDYTDRTADARRAREAEQAAERVWCTWLEAKWLPSDLSPEAARIYLQAVKEVQQKLRESDEARKKVKELKGELQAFRSKVDSLAEALGRAVDSEDVWGLETAQSWEGELKQQQELARKREGWQKQREQAERAECEARRKKEEAEQAMQDALNRAGAKDEDDLRQRARGFEELAKVKSELREVEAALRSSRDDVQWEEWQRKLREAAADWVQWETRLAEIEKELQAKSEEQSETDRAIGRLSGEINQLQTEADLAEAQQEREQAVTEVQRLGKVWAAQAAAQALLALTRQRYERERQPATILRTGELLRHITEGRWGEVLTREEKLLAVREDGGRLIEHDEEKLSRSTKEALFLCARWAAIEREIERCPLPVALDDTLVNFTPERLLQTVELVAKLSDKTQVIVFTGQPHIMEAFQRTKPKLCVLTLSPISTA